MNMLGKHLPSFVRFRNERKTVNSSFKAVFCKHFFTVTYSKKYNLSHNLVYMLLQITEARVSDLQLTFPVCSDTWYSLLILYSNLV